MVFFGIVLLIAAVICFFFARSQSNKLADLNATDTYTTQMLHDLHKKVVETLGAEALAEPCEIEGQVSCDNPLVAPISGQTCIAYRFSLTREYSEVVHDTDSEGRKRTRTQTGSETIKSEEECAYFWINDNLGKVWVDPTDAEIEYEAGENILLPSPDKASILHFGDFEFAAPASNKGARRTTGYRAQEELFTDDGRAYILGCVTDDEGEPTIAYNEKKLKRMIISRKTERELANSAAGWSRNLYYGAAGSAVAGIIFTIWGLL